MIAVAGIPRSGTTMVSRTLSGVEPGNTWKSFDDMQNRIVKTHDSNADAVKNRREIDKAIFMYGDPVLAVISTKMNRYNKTHFRNCGCLLDPKAVNIYEYDVLNYEKMFDAWTKVSKSCPTLCLRYETLHENNHVIEDFIQQKVKLPKRKERNTREDMVSSVDLRLIKKTYHGLIVKIEQVSDWFIV